MSIPEEEVELPPPAGSPPRRRLRRIVLMLFLLFVILVASAAGYTVWAMGGTPNGKPVRVIIPEGASGADIATLLAKAGVVRSAFIFRIVARIRGVGGDLKPGAYDLHTGLGVSAAITALRNGVPIKVNRVVIPEGKTVLEIARIVERSTGISANTFLRAASSGRHRLAIMPSGSRNLEGLLFPKSYEFVEKTTADEMIDAMLQQFQTETAGLDLSKARALGISAYQAVIVASLIEREAKVENDRPLIASVIYNRLHRGQQLQIDATVEYAILLRTGSYKNPLTFEDLKIDSPFNTYRIPALPPAPIASPGLPALQAALSPAKTDYFYYVLKSDQRSHCFARNEAEFRRCRNAA